KVDFWHTVTWAEDIMAKFYMKGIRYEPVKLLIKIFIWYAKRRMRDLERKFLPKFTGKELSIKSTQK
ncbi:MAG: radical SAM protein, partial [Ignisphaera sp.]|nr:radical SAM protein [Ignisphaera sp.]MDW8084948.1 radical SAM protein [Ignisphaera sp.]